MDNVVVGLYLLLINLAGFVMMGIDKNRAKRGAWRIPEKTLFTCALLGGSLGTTLGMSTFRHKTKHNYFVRIVSVLMVIQLALFFVFLLRLG